MKVYVYSLYDAELCIELEMFRTNILENLKHTFYSYFFGFRAFYKTIWNVCCSQTGHRYKYTIRCTRFACCITDAKGTHSEYVIHIGFPQNNGLHERAPALPYTYIHTCLHFTNIETNLLVINFDIIRAFF
jgi:hypothetical protein